jgi:hypothetical protein
VHITEGALRGLVAVVFTALVAAPVTVLANQAPQERPPQAQERKAPAPVQGELVKVDADAKQITVKIADGAEAQFLYNDKTEVTGAKDGVAGLATMTAQQVTVHFTEDAQTKAKVATRILIQPKQ